MGYLISGFDFHSVLEGYPDVILAINRDEINEALELDGVECCHKVFLSAKRSQKLPDRNTAFILKNLIDIEEFNSARANVIYNEIMSRFIFSNLKSLVIVK